MGSTQWRIIVEMNGKIVIAFLFIVLDLIEQSWCR